MNTVFDRRKRVKRQDVADAAGVSGAMVSYAFSDNEKIRISSETRKRICKIAAELGYTPSFAGKSLVKGKNYNIGLLMPARYTGSISFHCLNIFHGLCQAVEQTDYNLVTFFGEGEKYLKKIRQNRMDGVVILQSGDNNKIIEKTVEIGLPVVVVNRDYDISTAKNLGCVRSDYKQLMEDCFKFFWENNCKRILSINPWNACNPNMIIHNEFNRKCADYSSKGIFGLTISPDENFADQLRNMFSSGQSWDAYFVNGRSNLELLFRVAEEFNLVFDKDYKVFLSDTDTLNRRSDEKFPTYLPSQREMARAAWTLMQKLIDGENVENRKVLIPYRPEKEVLGHGHFKADVEWEKEHDIV